MSGQAPGFAPNHSAQNGCAEQHEQRKATPERDQRHHRPHGSIAVVVLICDEHPKEDIMSTFQSTTSACNSAYTSNDAAC